MQVTQQQWPGTPPPRPKPRYGLFVGGVLGLLVIVGVALNIGDTPVTRKGTTQAVVPTEQTAAPAGQVAAPAGQSAAPATAAGARTSFGDGTWKVGTHIEPGTYRSPGAVEGVVEYCSYSRLAEASSDSDRLSWGTAGADEPILIEIRPTDAAFKASGCETFTKAG